MPELFKLLARNCVLGIAAGWMTLALMIATNTGGLYDVIFSSSNPYLPIALLAAGFAITFGSISMGVAIMTLPYEGDEGKGKGLGVATLAAMVKAWFTVDVKTDRALVPVPVKGRRSKAR